MGPDWKNKEGLPSFGSFRGFLVVRPLLLTDGDCLAEKEEYRRVGTRAPYRVSEAHFSSWRVSRKDVGHFISEAVRIKWDNFKNKAVDIGF